MKKLNKYKNTHTYACTYLYIYAHTLTFIYMQIGVHTHTESVKWHHVTEYIDALYHTILCHILYSYYPIQDFYTVLCYAGLDYSRLYYTDTRRHARLDCTILPSPTILCDTRLRCTVWYSLLQSVISWCHVAVE